MKYTFGDTPTADQRLKKIADFFNPIAYNFIKSNLDKEVEVALDLGCGPGYTSNMLQGATNATKTYGLDMSAPFIKSARDYFPSIHFEEQNITSGPFPVKADAMYCRFLMSHLKNLDQVIELWLDNLNQGGVLIIDELENIQTDNEVFSKYLYVSNQIIRSQGANLYVGKELDTLVKKLNVECNESIIFPVQNYIAAEWFYPNTVSIWKTDKLISQLTTEIERNSVSRNLFEISQNKIEFSNICWTMKHIIISKG